jgi:hypothetical protein
MKRGRVLSIPRVRGTEYTGRLWTPDGPRRAASEKAGFAYFPPFAVYGLKEQRSSLVKRVLINPHPTDLVLDTSLFSPARVSLVREILVSCSPIILPPVVQELEDLKAKPALAELCDIVFKGGALNPRFRGDDCGVLHKYRRFSMRYINLLRWRRDMIAVPSRNIARDTGIEPTGEQRSKLIRNLLKGGMGTRTIALANKDYNPRRPADEVLAVFAALSPIVTGRDCFLFTADQDVLDQVLQMIEMIFDDYGAYLIAKDFRANESRYDHRHPWKSLLFDGPAEAIGRLAHPDYLLPRLPMIQTCATTVIDVNKLEGFTWVSARNIEAAISFQDADPLSRKGDPGAGRSILFSAFAERESPAATSCTSKTHHFVIGTPTYLKVSPKEFAEEFGPIPQFDLFRAGLERRERPRRKSRLVTPFEHDQLRLEAALDRAFRFDAR